ncbi:MAG: DUF3089 domain-containing protein [Lachnospiraceae bacterium]|nr:DUF3089 domain-containing protein [Lachnospiraceae bacterium]
MKKTAAIILAILTAGMLFAGCTVQVRDYPGEVSGEAGIDYSKEENWAYYGIGQDRQADLFLICPTVDTGDDYNMDLDDEETKEKFVGALNMERGIYEETTRMYAPYYRQMAMKGYSLDEGEREQYLQIAYEDISDAFSYYLDNINDGRPIVLAGFSQGADMCYRLLEEYFGDEELSKQLVAVYAIGWPCSKELVEKYPQIKPASGETDTGVVVSFDCEAPEVTESFIIPEGSENYTINPLNWMIDGTVAGKRENPGSCFTDYDGNIKSEEKALCGCYIDEERGVLKVTDISPKDYPAVLDILPEGGYHIYDYQFFFRSLQENVGKRIEAFFGGPEYISEGDDTICEITGYTEYDDDGERFFLSEGDKVAVISPSALPSREQVDAVMNGLEEWGFEPVEGKYVCQETRTLDELTEDLTWALSDDEIKAIFCVRGGYGATGAMDTITEDTIKEARKPIIGYSDITVYHSAWTQACLPSVHACMSGTFTDLPDDCREAELQMMMGNIPSYSCSSNEAGIDGRAEGILIGGNLSTFTATLGTDYDSTLTDEPYILFLEEVGENIQHIHRYLTILKHAGVLDRAEGIIFGEWTELPANGSGNFGDARGGKYESVADMIRREFLQDCDIPVAFGFPAGHADVNYPLLMGEELELSVSGSSFTLEWDE